MSSLSPQVSEKELSERSEFAREIAQKAGDLTLEYFRSPQLEVEQKADESPVTVADRRAEELLRELISQRFPQDAVLGEEFGESTGNSGWQWILDPIDGTKSFVAGVPLYATMIGVTFEGVSRIGAINAAAAGEMVTAATGHGAWLWEGDGEGRRVSVRKTEQLANALLLTTDVPSFEQGSPAGGLERYTRLSQQVRLSRTWGDAFGYLLVATGRADIMIDPRLNVWDAAPLVPILAEAGGKFTDWQGAERIDGGNGLASNGMLHESVLKILVGP